MQIQRFNFSTLPDFKNPVTLVKNEPLEAPVAADDTPPPPPPPTYSQAELDAVKARAYEEGRQAGIMEGRALEDSEANQRLKVVEQFCHRLSNEISMIEIRHVASLNAQAVDLGSLVLRIAKKVAGDAVAKIPIAGIEAMVNECMGILIHQPKIILTVHPDLANFMSDHMARRLRGAGVDGELVVAGDASLQAAEARLEWRDGMIERDLNVLWEQIDSKLKSVDFTLEMNKVSKGHTQQAEGMPHETPIDDGLTANDIADKGEEI